jgi:hypothetical protein
VCTQMALVELFSKLAEVVLAFWDFSDPVRATGIRRGRTKSTSGRRIDSLAVGSKLCRLQWYSKLEYQRLPLGVKCRQEHKTEVKGGCRREYETIPALKGLPDVSSGDPMKTQ